MRSRTRRAFLAVPVLFAAFGMLLVIKSGFVSRLQLLGEKPAVAPAPGPPASPARSGQQTTAKPPRPHPPAQAPAAGAVTVPPSLPDAPAAIKTFRQWAADYFTAEPGARAGLVERGITLAREHRAALKTLIPADPRGAIENAVPMVVRQDLPADIVSELEERVNQRGELILWASVPADSTGQATGTPPPPAYSRIFIGKDERIFKAFAYGGRLDERTLTETQINGVAVDQMLAVADSRIRTLEVGERPDPAKTVSETCPVSGITTVLARAPSAPPPPITPETPAYEDETTVHYVCYGGHVGMQSTKLMDEETQAHWNRMTHGASVAAEGGTGGPMAPFSVPSSWTSGLRKVLYIRVTFPDNLQDPQSETQTAELMRQVNNEMVSMSYGRMYMQTTITPLLVLTRTQAWLSKAEDDGMDSAFLIYREALVLAKAAGYDPDQYDLDVVRWNGPVGDFGGAASVGGRMFLDKAGSVGTCCHEFGHNFGLSHSNGFKGSPPSLNGPGYSIEYGNYFDFMGTGAVDRGHYVTPSKAQLGWLGREFQTLAETSGTYRIFQADQSQADPMKRYTLRIHKDAERDYWFEHRPLHPTNVSMQNVGSSRVDLQACKLEYSIVSPK